VDKGFKGDEGQAWNEFTTLAMASIPEDKRDDRDILSMMEPMALVNVLPPERFYPHALCTAFHSQFASLKAITVAQQVSPL
jgi:hypothetical protein